MNPLRTGPLASRNKHRTAPDYTAMNILSDFLTSRSGWITRKAIDTATPVLAGWATYAAAHGVPGDITAGLHQAALASITWLVGLGLSALADKANKALVPLK